MSGETLLHVDGQLVQVKAGSSVAAALRVAGGMGHLTLDDTALRFLANLDNPLPSHLRWSAKRRQAGLDAARRLLEGKDGSGQGE